MSQADPQDARARQTARLVRLALVLAALAGPACGGGSIFVDPDGGLPGGGGGSDGGGGSGSDGGGCILACSLDSECNPPFLVCQGTCCGASCQVAGCSPGLECLLDGHCRAPASDGGGSGGSDGGGSGGSDGGGPGGHDGGAAGSGDGGFPGDPGPLSGNLNGCGFCQPCERNSDCEAGSWCAPAGWPGGGGCKAGCTSPDLIPGLLECFALGAPNLTWGCNPAGGHGGDLICGGDTPCPAPADGGVPACDPQGYSATGSCADGGTSLPGASAWGDDVPVAAGPSPAAEVALAASAGGDLLALTGLGSAAGAGAVVAQRSTDSGLHWTSPAGVPSGSEQQRDPALVVQRWVDGTTARERIAAAWVGYRLASGAEREAFVEVAATADLGASWTGPVRATRAADTAGGTLAFHHPAAAADKTGALLVAWSAQGLAGSSVAAARSTDRGATFAPAAGPAGAAAGNHSFVALAADPSFAGTVWAAWIAYEAASATSTSKAQVLAARSDDLGLTWSAPLAASAAGELVALDPPGLAVDAQHRVFVVYAASPSGGSAVRWNVQSAQLDGAASPAAVVARRRASGEADGCSIHLHPRVVAAGGREQVAWLSNRGDGRGRAWTGSAPVDANPFPAPALVSSGSFPFDPTPASAGARSLGRTLGWAQSNGLLHLLWLDPRGVTSSQPRFNAGPP